MCGRRDVAVWIVRGRRAAVAPAHHVPAPEVRGVHVLLETRATESEVVAVQAQSPLHPLTRRAPVARPMTCNRAKLASHGATVSVRSGAGSQKLAARNRYGNNNNNNNNENF